MTGSLLELDKELLLTLNGLHSPFFDTLMWWVSKTSVWIPLYLAFAAAIILRFRKQAWVIIPVIVLLITCADQTSVHLFKNAFLRLRPSHEPSLTGLVHLVNNYHGGMYGFISSHAANTFAFAVFVSFLFRNRWVTAGTLVWATLLSYSRIYLGVHYPGDILCGAVWGTLMAVLFWFITKTIFSKYFTNRPHPDADPS